MRTRGKVALGGGLASAAVAGWLVAAGVFATTATLVVTDPLAPPAQAEADALTSFEGCSELLDWYVSHGVKDVGPYGWGGRFYALDSLAGREVAGPQALAMTPTSGNAVKDSTSSATGTNTQEQNVDEPDVAKTNGTLVVRIANNDRSVALIDVTGAEPKTVGKYRLPADGYNAQLLLVGDRVLVTQQVYDGRGGGYYPTFRGRGMWAEDRMMPSYGGEGSVRVLDLDIADPSSPKLVRKDVYSGTLASARQYGDTVRLVTTTGRPELDWVTPGKKVTEKEATQRNRALVRATTIEDWLPRVRGAGASSPLLDCEDVFHPKAWSGAETVAVSTYAMADPGQRNAVGITATGQVVYSSGDRLYVASTEMEFADVVPLTRGAGPEPRIVADPPKVTTNLHAFALEGTGTSYAGSGHVDGSLRDRWSLDEYDGRLRVAWSTSDQRGWTNNGITVLAERNGKLVPTGTVTGLGKNENIQSVRWFDDLAIMVTFRQIDPLYTIDLTDQDDPKPLGALKIPGFSGYLHPVGDHLLLGLGVDATMNGRTLGAQAAVFDINDLRKPVRVSKAEFGPQTALTAIDDPRGFTWLAGSSTGVTPVADWRSGGPVLKALEVSSSGQLRTRTVTDLNQDWQARTLELPGGRIAVLDHERVRLISID